MDLFLLIVIVFSSVAIIFAVLSKNSEIQTGKGSFFSKFLTSHDRKIVFLTGEIKKILFHLNGRNIVKVFRSAAFGSIHFFGMVGLFLSKYYAKLSNRIKGKKFIKEGGVVSFFLKNMSESKGEEKEDI